MVAAVVAAPLAAGGVHRITLIVLEGVAAAALALLAWNAARNERPLRIGLTAWVPLVFLLIPALQVIPLPLAIRQIVDPKGTALLTTNLPAPPTLSPLSLDPPSTRADIGKAAAALAIFLAAYHLASGQRRRQALLRAIGIAGVAAVAIGLGHRLVGATKIYGVLTSTHRTILIGPFVNANHTAEFLELAAFVCLACSFQKRTALNRVGWLAGTAWCLGGAAATLSRGGVAAMAMGVLMFVFLRSFATDETAVHRRRASLAWGGLLIGLVVLGASAFGAIGLLDRFHAGAITSDLRLQLWRDSLKVLLAHPFGIGRGAFDRVFPVYRTIGTSFPLRFAFVENEPLQLLIDSGWLFFVPVVAAIGLVIWQIARRGKRDGVEAALVTGLFAIMIHNLVDFGLETPGVLLPFMAVLGTVLGRIQPPDARPVGIRTRQLLVAATCGLAVVGMASVASGSYDDFDALLKRASSPPERAALLVRAQRAHPTDYYFALLEARLEPLKGPPGAASPRFHALNRALMLCPSCDAVHAEIARNLWSLGLRRQALLEWRTAIDLRPDLLVPSLRELYAGRASPQELASAAASTPARVVEAAQFLTSAGTVNQALSVLDQAEALGAARDKVLPLRAQLQLQSGHVDQAIASLAQARAAGLRDPRLPLLDAQVLLATQAAAGADQALRLLDAASAQYPEDLAIQRARVELVMTYQKWQAADRALDGLKQALYRAGGTATEAHVDGARISTRLSRWTNALGEYRIALAEQGSEVGLWMEYGHAAELAGRSDTAREAYAQAARLNPSDASIANALKALDDHRVGSLRLDPMRPTPGP